MLVSKITDNLFIGKTPKRADFNYLKNNNIKNIVNMRADYFWFDTNNPQGILITWVPTIDFILLPINAKKLMRTALEMSKKIQSGEKVLCFCRMGRQRSVAMAAAILVTQGYSADDAMHHIKLKRPIADPYARHIKKTIYQFENLWIEKKSLL